MCGRWHVCYGSVLSIIIITDCNVPRVALQCFDVRSTVAKEVLQQLSLLSLLLCICYAYGYVM